MISVDRFAREGFQGKKWNFRGMRGQRFKFGFEFLGSELLFTMFRRGLFLQQVAYVNVKPEASCLSLGGEARCDIGWQF